MVELARKIRMQKGCASHREIVARFDLENLNMRPEFAASVPTTENLCTVIYDILKQKFSLAHLERVRLEETMMNSFEYCGD